MKKSILVTLFFTAIFATSFKCKKDIIPPDNPYGLPNATQTGENIFACRVNGENWISEKGMYNMRAGITDTSFGVHGGKTISSISGEQFDIGIKNAFIQGNNTYSLGDTAYKFARYWGLNVKCFDPNGGYNTIIVKAFNGEATFTRVDRINKIVSGKFWFYIKTDYCDTLKITEGRFDIKY